MIPAVSAGFSLMLPFSCLLLTHSCNEGWGEPGDSRSESLRELRGKQTYKTKLLFFKTCFICSYAVVDTSEAKGE